MKPFKKYIAEEFIGRKLHFECDCIFPLNHSGTIIDYEISHDEILFVVDINGKLIKIGENHPNLLVKSI